MELQLHLGFSDFCLFFTSLKNLLDALVQGGRSISSPGWPGSSAAGGRPAAPCSDFSLHSLQLRLQIAHEPLTCSDVT